MRPKFKLKHKFFLTLLGTSLLFIFAMMGVMRFTTQTGIDKLFEEDLAYSYDQLAMQLENLYSWNGSWDFILKSPEKWQQLLNDHNLPFSQTHQEELFDPSFTQEDLAEISEPFPESQSVMATDELRLLNLKRETIVGPKTPSEGEQLIPLYGQTGVIGFLAVPIVTHFVDASGIYLEKQTRMIWIASVAMILFAVVIAIILAYHLQGPIQELTHATRLLASGTYDVRVPVKSRDEIGQLSRDFNELARVLERNETARKKWVADISHELKTPIALLGGEIEAIEDGIRELNHDTVKLFHHDITQLTRLIKDLEELSRSDLGALSYQKAWHPSDAIFAHPANTFMKDFKQKDIRLTIENKCPADMRLFVDLERINQLVSNLFQNALRYTDAGGMLEATLTCSEETVIMVVEDSAPGVAEKDLPHLFDRLFRVDESRNRSLGGSGIGLSICKNIVEAHGGIISAAPSRLGGLRIHISFQRSDIAS